MATVEVILSEDELLAAGTGGDPRALYHDAEVDEAPGGLLVVRRGSHVLAEYPRGRYMSWAVVPESRTASGGNAHATK